MKTCLKSVIFVLALGALLPCFAPPVAIAADCYLTAPGCLDATFGGGTGKVLINTDGNISSSFDLDQARGVAIQTDGKIVAAGTTSPRNITKFVVVRVNADGSLDPTFGNAGIVTTSFSTGSARAYAVALQSDGKIVVVGTSVDSHNVFAVARYNQLDGSLDATFGSGGKTTVSFGNKPHDTTDTEARSVAIQADGKIVVGGFVNNTGSIARLNSNGSLDASFASGGKLTTSIGGNSESVVIQADGKIVLGGYANGGRTTGYDFALARYNANGSIDTSFGNGGVATADFSGFEDRIRAVTIDGNNNIVAAGFASTGLYSPAFKNFAVARFTPSGQLDSTFGAGGKVTTDIFGNWDDCYALAIQADGKILADGFSYDASGAQSYFTVIRYNTNGTLDGNFGAGGIVTTNMAGGPDNWAYGLAIQANGMIVAGGTGDTINSSDGFYVALARYFP
jgi:uncharacterized delta-60 repeat protein